MSSLPAAEVGRFRARAMTILAQRSERRTDAIDSIMAHHGMRTVHFMSSDVEGAESVVLQGLSLEVIRPWVLCIEAVDPGTTRPSRAGPAASTTRLPRSLPSVLSPSGRKWSPDWELNPRPLVYKTNALPLSYKGTTNILKYNKRIIQTQ